MKKQKQQKKGSIELIVLGLIGALVVVICIPFIVGIGNSTQSTLSDLNQWIDNRGQ